MNEKVTLYTIQPIEWYQKLLKQGIIYGKPDKNIVAELEFTYAYNWISKQMENRISKAPLKDLLPIWSWFQYDNIVKRKPDLRNSAHLEKGTKGVRIEFIKNRKDILLSDFQLWHLPLMYYGINDSEKESLEFDEKLKSHNIDCLDKENYPIELKQEIEKSWEKIFNMDYCPEYTAVPFDKKSIQATFWSLSVDEIVHVDEFTAR